MIKRTIQLRKFYYSVQFQQIRKTRSLGTSNTINKVMKIDNLPQFDIQQTYLKSDWIHLINNIAEKNEINNETETIIQQFNDNGNLLFTIPDQDLQLFTNIIRISKESNNALNLEDKRWFYTSLNQNNRLIPIYLSYLKQQTVDKVLIFIGSIGLCNPDTQTQIIYQMDQQFKQSEITDLLYINLPIVTIIKKMKNIYRLKILYKKSGKLQQNAHKFLEQIIIILTENRYGDWIIEDKKILSLVSEISGLMVETQSNLKQLLRYLSCKIIKLKSPQHVSFLTELIVILKGKKLIDNIDFLDDDVQQSFKIELISTMTLQTFELFVKNLSFNEFYIFLQNKSSEDRFIFLNKFSQQQLEILNHSLILGQRLQSLEPSQTYLNLVGYFETEPILSQEKIQLTLQNIKRIDPFIFYSLFQIKMNFKESTLLDSIKIDDLITSYKQIVFVVNKICDKYPSLLGDEQIMNKITQKIVLHIHLCDQEDLQRVLFILQKIPLTMEEFQVISVQLNKGIKDKLNQIQSQNKLVSMLYCLSSLKRQYQFEDQDILNIFDEKISQVISFKIFKMIDELSGNNLFLIHKTLQFTKGLPILQSRLKSQIIVFQVYIKYQKGKFDEYLPGKINYVATQIKQSQSYLPHQSSVENIIEQLQVVKQDQISIQLLSDLSNLILKIEKHGRLDQKLITIHKFFMEFVGNVDFTNNSHILQATLLYQDDVNLILDKVDTKKIKAFELFSIFSYLVQAQMFDSPHYQLLKDQILQRPDLFRDSSTKNQVDKGLLSLSFFVGSLDQDSNLIESLCEKYQSQYIELIDEIQSQNYSSDQQKQYNVNMYNQISSINALQLYEGAIFTQQIHGYNNELINKILKLKDLVVIINKKNAKTLSQGSSFEKEVQQILQLIVSPEQIIKEYDLVEPFRIDLYIPHRGIGIECDGHQHLIKGKLKRSNQLRNQIIEKHGIKIHSIQIEQWRVKSEEEKIKYLSVLFV